MTTLVTIKNEHKSNPLQELVVLGYNTCGGEADRFVVLQPGESRDYWIAGLSTLTLVERQSSVPPKLGAEPAKPA